LVVPASAHRLDRKVYDALFAAAKRLDPPQFGDTLVLFGHMYDVAAKLTLIACWGSS